MVLFHLKLCDLKFLTVLLLASIQRAFYLSKFLSNPIDLLKCYANFLCIFIKCFHSSKFACFFIHINALQLCQLFQKFHHELPLSFSLNFEFEILQFLSNFKLAIFTFESIDLTSIN